MPKRTKIIATLGPASATPEMVEKLIAAGVDVFRLNMSHGDHAGHERALALVRAAEARQQRAIGVLADLQGPKMRVGRMAGGVPVEWVAGRRTVITVAPCPEGTAERVGSDYKGLAQDVKPGNHLLVDDGKMRLLVEKVEGDDVHCLIEVGGKLKNNKGINLPGVRVSAPPLTDKDLRDLAWAVAQGVDFIALSFVHTHHDVIDLKRRIAELGGNAAVVAKVELPEAVEDIDAIARESDAVMVARGDLGIEISAEWLPMVQKDIIRAVNRHGRIAITATQMLESMIELPVPTRAETTDVANAIIDGTDAVMLSAETASGAHPLEAVSIMSRLALVAERSHYLVHVDLDREPGTFSRQSVALARAATVLADERRAAALVVADHDPQLIRLLCERRGDTPVVAACLDRAEARRFALFWGVFPLVGEGEDLIASVITKGKAHQLFQADDELVVVRRQPWDAIVVRHIGA
jgi:pyruvate kinase